MLLDSDEVEERLIRAGLELAGMNSDERDSPAYKAAFREQAPVVPHRWVDTSHS